MVEAMLELANKRPQLDDDEFEEEEQVDEADEKMREAVALNQQLKAMMAEMEAAQLQQQQASSRARGAALSHARGAPPGTNIPRGAPSPHRGKFGGTSHTVERSNEIDRDNQILVSKLSNIALRPTVKTRQEEPFRLKNSSIAINRRRKDDQIAHENAKMAQRLNSVKATSTLSNKTAQQHAKRHNDYLRITSGAAQHGQPLMACSGPVRARTPASRTAILPALRGPPGGGLTGQFPIGPRPPFE